MPCSSLGLGLALDSPLLFASGWGRGATQTITSTTFGRITSTFFGWRLIQFGMYYRF